MHANAASSIVTTLFGISICLMLFPENAEIPIYARFELSSNVTEVSEIHFSNAYRSMYCTFFGILTSTSEESILNALAGMVVTPLPIVSERKLKILAKADLPNEITLSGIVKAVKFAPKNALLPIVCALFSSIISIFAYAKAHVPTVNVSSGSVYALTFLPAGKATIVLLVVEYNTPLCVINDLFPFLTEKFAKRVHPTKAEPFTFSKLIGSSKLNNPQF